MEIAVKLIKNYDNLCVVYILYDIHGIYSCIKDKPVHEVNG